MNKELHRIIAEKVKKSSVNVAEEANLDPSPKNRHQVAQCFALTFEN